MLNKKKLTIWLVIAGLVLILAAVGVYYVYGHLIPYNKAQNTMDPDGILTICTQNDGKLRVEWPAGENAQTYKLQVLETDGEVLYSCSTRECFSALPELPMDRELVIRVTCGHDYGKKTRPGDEALEATLKLASPKISQLQWTADVATATVDVTFNMDEGELCRVYMATGDGAPTLVEELDEGKVTLRFGEGKDYAIPTHEEPLAFSFQLEKNSGQVSYRGDTLEGFTVTREDLLGSVLNTEYTHNGDNEYTLTWNETKGEHYEVRISTDGENWTTLASIPNGQERTYTTKHLNAYTDYQLWVVAVGGQTLPDSEFAAYSEPVEITTGAKLLYSTIWPLMDQKVYGDVECTQELGTAAAGSAWCVIGQEGDLLKIRFAGQEAYIDSSYCMINLPEYIGQLCEYDITNSYYSIYLVHEFGIANVSGTVITGYEDVQVGEDEYLVPLLFPTAQKLIKAGEAAREQGYTLKIYDSYRPKNATDRIYALTGAILDDPVPVSTFSGKRVTDLDLLDWEYEEEEEEETPPEEIPEEPDTGETTEPSTEESTQDSTDEPSEDPADESTEDAAAPEKKRAAAAQTEEEEEPWYGLMRGLTYEILMTNDGEYLLSAFLAPGNSRHNYGVALDLTLVDENGNELAMQTSMHDLSWYSASKRNNTNAYTLYKIMTGAGFKDLFSEWWHFQDNEIYEANELEPLKTGISWQCWTLDETGWRYRLADGSFYTSCTQTIEGEIYTFDENGYVVEE